MRRSEIGRRRKQGPDKIVVLSETVSQGELERRKKRLLDVSHNRSAGDGADVFVVNAEIAAAAEDVWALVDWADERNARRQLGDEVRSLDADGRRFRLAIRFMPDVHFDYEVLKAERPAIYEYECLISPPQGHLGRTLEQFRIEALAEDKCAVTMTVTAYFEDGLSAAEQEEAIHTMTVGVHNGLAKVKAYAEYGVGTIEAFENLRLMPL